MVMKAAIVVPTNRPQHVTPFLDAWQGEFAEATTIIVEDNPTRTVDLGHRCNVVHYSWEDIDRDLGTLSWIIPRRTDCIRSYGYYKACQLGVDLIVTLDDDCYPSNKGTQGFLDHHWTRLNETSAYDAWMETGKGMIPRGVPYFNRQRRRPVVINHGLWEEAPDLDAPTQLVHSRFQGEFAAVNQTIPVGKYFPMSGMNLAFRPIIVPALYFLLMGRDSEYDRCGDIWAGIIVKKICDHLGYGITSGDPTVVHKRASNVWMNLRKELPGLELNETLWEAVDQVVLTASTVTDAYREVSQKLVIDTPSWVRMREAMAAWCELLTAPTRRPTPATAGA